MSEIVIEVEQRRKIHVSHFCFVWTLSLEDIMSHCSAKQIKLPIGDKNVVFH